MAVYRMGEPGTDAWVHINYGRRASVPFPCAMEKFPLDAPRPWNCARTSVALCDAPGCETPICERHRTKHPTKPNTDYCVEHKDMAVVK